MDEQWRPIPIVGYDHYLASTEGTIRRRGTNRDLEMEVEGGRNFVVLQGNDQELKFFVDHLILLTFKPAPKNRGRAQMTPSDDDGFAWFVDLAAAAPFELRRYQTRRALDPETLESPDVVICVDGRGVFQILEGQERLERIVSSGVPEDGLTCLLVTEDSPPESWRKWPDMMRQANGALDACFASSRHDLLEAYRHILEMARVDLQALDLGTLH